jgi:capsular exopolysaccharide synthesis family protein
MPLIRLDKPVGQALSKEIEQKQGVLIESVRVLRTALLTRLDGQGHATVVMTSANRGTGKSSVTLVLGRSIAQAGRKVLLIDADFRRMGLSKRLNMASRPGFRESLKDGTAENLHVFPTGTAGLDVMPAGLRGQDSSVYDEIAHDAFKSWLGQLYDRHGYQIVLLDTPPLLPVADAAILAGQADATILVEREQVSRRAEVASALLLLRSAGGHLLGTVFVGSANDERYGCGYGYGYYGQRASES